MAYTGQSIYNAITGEHITFIRTTRDTGGRSLVFDCRVGPNNTPLPPHVHATQEERFTVYGGCLGVMLGGKRQVLYPGESIILPARVKHQWWNAGESEVYFRVTVIPPRNLETTLEVISNLVADGKMNKRCMPRDPFHLVNLGRLSETYLPGIPVWMQKIALGAGALFGRLLGYDPSFARYRTTAALPAVAAAEEQRAA